MSEITDSKEFKDALASAIADEVKGLKDKNVELLGEIKKLRKGQEIDPATVERLENERDDALAKLSDANKAANKAAKTAEEAVKKLGEADSRERQLLVDNGLTDALSKNGVSNPILQKAAKALLAGQVQIVADGENRVAKVGEKALADFAKEWAGSDEGKHFVTAASASGSGSQGGSRTNTGKKSVSRSAFDAMDASSKMEHTKSGGQVTD